jgi:hypothetical protein
MGEFYYAGVFIALVMMSCEIGDDFTNCAGEILDDGAL